MARLPQPGGDDGQWGAILNEYLGQAHKTDGSLKDNSVTSAALAPGAVTGAGIANATVTEAKLDSALQAKVNGVGGGGALTLAGDVTGVSTSTVVEKVRGVSVSATAPSAGQVLTASGAAAASWQTPSAGAVTSVAGRTGAVTLGQSDIANLTTDLAGKASASHTHAASDITSGTVETARLGSGTANNTTYLRGDGTWATPAGGGGAVTSVAGRTGDVTLAKADVGLNNVDNTSDVGKPVSTATQTALNAKANQSTTYTMSEVDTALSGKASTSHTHTLDNLSDVTASGATNGQSLVFNAGTWGPADVGTGGTVVDATDSVKGVVQLAGDLAGAGGSAAAPKVSGLQGVSVTTTAPSNGQVLTYNGANAVWSTPSGGGGGTYNVISVSTNYSAQVGDYILADASTGFTVTLPTAVSAGNGAEVCVKKIDSSLNAVDIVVSGGGVIDSTVSDPISLQWESHDYISNGTQWYLV